MNLKEIGILLVSLYGLTILLMGYKYYHAKGGVFQLTGLLIIKYILRFLSLVAILFLCYNVIISKQIAQKQINTKPKYLIAMSDKYSSLSWKEIKGKMIEMPQNGEYGLILFDKMNSKWNQIIPATNKDSFMNLLEHVEDAPLNSSKRVFEEPIPHHPKEDQFSILRYSGNTWSLDEGMISEDNFLSKNTFLSWVQASYVPLYLVILLLVFSFLDIVFPIKALKI